MELADSVDCRVDLTMAPVMRLAVIVGVTVASWIVPSALIYGILQLV